MTRVLMTADAVGGVWTYALELARALAAHDIRTTLATMGPRPTTTQLAQAARVPGLELEIREFPLEWMLDIDGVWDAVADAGRWLLDLESAYKPDVVHVNGYAHGGFPFRAPVIVVGHSCLVSWCEANRGHFEPFALGVYRDAVTQGLRAASAVVAPSVAMLGALQRHYGPFDRATVIPNGRDPDVVSSGPKEPIVATAGRLWDTAKNAGAVAAVASDLEWPVASAGSSELRTPLQPQDDVLALLARSAIFALPARYEPFGLLPLEAGLAGCALVLGDIDSLREVWADAAMYVDPDDRDALRSTVQLLIADCGLREEMAARARERALRYSPAAMASAYAQLYSAVGAARRCA
jgi:glycogen synthase